MAIHRAPLTASFRSPALRERVLRTSVRSLLRHLALLRLDRLLGFGIDPPGIEADARISARPAGGGTCPNRRRGTPPDVKLRDHVIAVLQHPVERMRVGDEARRGRAP